MIDNDEMMYNMIVRARNKGKFALVEPVLKPEDLIACRVQFEGRWHTHSF